MNARDLILVSVDDHLVEPPHMFEGRLPARYADAAPTVERRADGSDVWVFNGSVIPNIGLNAVAGRPKEEYGVEPTAFDEMRPGCYDVHERIKDMNAGGVLGSMCFPSFPGFSGRLFAACEDKDLALAVAAGVQRLAHRRVVRRLSRAVHPDGPAGAVGSRAGGRRGPARGRQGLSLHHLHREPGHARVPELPRRRTGTRCGRPSATRASSCPSTWARPASWPSRRPTRRSTS